MNVIPIRKQQDNQQWISGYAEWISDKSERTIDAYLRIIRQFLSWIIKMPGGKEGFKPDLFTRTAVDTYFKKEINQLSISHKLRVKTVLNDFAEWLIDQDLIKKNPTREINIPAIASLAPRELSPDQRYILKNLIERQGDQRSAAMFALGYWAGLRVSDVSHLLMKNLQIGPKIGSIITGYKGEKLREIPVLNEVRRTLSDYIQNERSKNKHADSPYVFPSQRGERLTENGIHHWFRTLKAKATKDEWPLIEDLTFHDLRHDWAHRAREAGWPLEYVAVYLGHTKKSGAPAIETTVRYTQPGIKSLRDKLNEIEG